jgi:ABC-type phosphate transport system substrate-binding protein
MIQSKYLKWAVGLFVGAGIFFLIAPVFSSAQAAVHIIANKSVAADKLTRRDLKMIFLGDTVFWKDGQDVSFVLSGDRTLHSEFIKTYIRKSPSQFKNYWRRMVFIGRASFPIAMETDKDVIDFVSKTRGAIGYISARPTSSNVKRINISDE